MPGLSRDVNPDPTCFLRWKSPSFSIENPEIFLRVDPRSKPGFLGRFLRAFQRQKHAICREISEVKF